MLIVILYLILALITGDSGDGGASSRLATIFNFPIGASKNTKDFNDKMAIQSVVTPQDLDSKISEYYVNMKKLVSKSGLQATRGHTIAMAIAFDYLNSYLPERLISAGIEVMQGFCKTMGYSAERTDKFIQQVLKSWKDLAAQKAALCSRLS